MPIKPDIATAGWLKNGETETMFTKKLPSQTQNTSTYGTRLDTFVGLGVSTMDSKVKIIAVDTNQPMKFVSGIDLVAIPSVNQVQ